VTSDEIRQLFLEFFRDRGHKVISSSSLIPHGDPTLLLTTAGMVQIKPYFLGLKKPPSLRLASCQKCFRTTDIDTVGDGTHLTYFEMLGNFSVGDYFKKEAISWAWEFVTDYLKLPGERLWITVYLDDDEAFGYWRQAGVPAERILRFGEEDNFWGPTGDSGPCGPCSEIHYDLGEEIGCGRPECKPNCDCGRFSEIWNLVFTQYNQSPDGSRVPLPKPNIDTGMGLERTAAAMQGKSSVYETDLFSLIIQRICQLAGKNYGDSNSDDRAIRIIAEHGRGIPFLIADGVLPSNEGRGYVLRRILRRASLFGRRLGLDKPFLNEVAEVVIDRMGHVYPELIANRNLIGGVIKAEEDRFIATLDVGLNSINVTFQQMQESLQRLAEQTGKALQPIQENKLSSASQRAFQQMQESLQRLAEQTLSPASQRAFQQMQESLQRLAEQTLSPASQRAFQQMQESFKQIQKITTISGREVFKLHDTFGFPQELTAEIARERGLSIDRKGFQAEMEKQRERARAEHKFASDTAYFEEGAKVEYKPEPTDFIGYDSLQSRSKISYLLDQGSGIAIPRAGKGKLVAFVLDKTPFYAEMGGQVGDIGKIICPSGWADITKAAWSPFGNLAAGAIVHQGKVIEGSISVGDKVEAKVDVARRLDIAGNHTATHLLQAALREVLGSHVCQRGSLVEPGGIRFDFSHLAAITEEQLTDIQRRVNERIRQNLPVKTKVVPYRKAVDEGAIALFEEKYGENVRVVEIGEPAISKELCGGTHLKSTGGIGLFLITGESSIGTGLRRIEAVTGREAELLVENRLAALEGVVREVGSSAEEAHIKVKAVIAELEKERRRSISLERELSRKIVDSLLEQAKQVNGITVLSARVPSLSMPILREAGDMLRDKLVSAIVVLATIYNDKPNFLAMVTPDLVARGFHASDIIKQLAEVTGGGGGGKASMAQAGGKDASKIDEALKMVKNIIADRAS
jgi:alanyl-tRNA synthetase